MHTKTVEVTPELAQKMLTAMGPNRKITRGRVMQYAKDMKANLWRENGETLKFGADGVLIDGQHRLEAVVIADKSIPFLVAYDLDEKAFDTIDTGKARTSGDVLSVMEKQNAQAIASAIRQQVLFERGIFTGSPHGFSAKNMKSLVTNHDVVACFKRLPKYEAIVSTFYNRYYSQRLFSPSIGCLFLYQFSEQNDEKATEFFMIVCGKLDAPFENPARLLRERLLNNRISKRKYTPKYIAAIIIKAWVAFRDGKRPKELRFGEDDNFPTFEIAA